MENILLVVNVILAVILVIIVLLQKSEGGALGIGVSQESFMFSRTAGDFMTKATAIIATLFIICSLSLTIISRGDLETESSVIDKMEQNSGEVPKIPENDQSSEGYSISVEAARQVLPKHKNITKKYILNVIFLHIYFFSLTAAAVEKLELDSIGSEIDIGKGLVFSIFGKRGNKIIK